MNEQTSALVSNTAERVREQMMTVRLVAVLGTKEAQRHVRENNSVTTLVNDVQKQES